MPQVAVLGPARIAYSALTTVHTPGSYDVYLHACTMQRLQPASTAPLTHCSYLWRPGLSSPKVHVAYRSLHPFIIVIPCATPQLALPRRHTHLPTGTTE